MKTFRTPSRNESERRPTLLVADDNALILEKASKLLASDYDVVGAVTDGQQALNASLLLRPDVVVLDVSMPELDGFQVTRSLRTAGSSATIVMLTMHESSDFVVVAVECGAQGYVLKTRMHWDLPSAIEHGLAGRMFMPSLSSLVAVSPSGLGGHAVHFRHDGSAFLDEMSELVGAALARGEMAAVIATETTRAGIAQRLIASGCDLAGAQGRGAYVSQDAVAAALEVTVGGRLDIGRFEAGIEQLERARIAASASHLTVVGEMPALLWRDGNAAVSIQRELAWNDLTRGLPFLTVCSYPMELFNEDEDPEAFRGVCASHGSVCHARSL